MNRRTLVAGAGTALAAFAAGCVGDTLGCPAPDASDELPYEVREPTDAQIASTGESGVVLVTDETEVDRVGTGGGAASADAEWVGETAFDERVVVGVQVGTPANSSELRVRGVERDGDAVRVYSRVAEPGRNDAWTARARLLRVPHGGSVPDAARCTHCQGGDVETYATGE